MEKSIANTTMSNLATSFPADTKDSTPSKPTTFLTHPTTTPLLANGFYDYGRGRSTLRVDHVQYTLSLSPTGTLTGTSSDAVGSASISGSIDPATHAVKFTKQYGLSNFWCKWAYEGVLSEDGRRIWGRWSGAGKLGEGFWGIWLRSEEEGMLVGRERVGFEVMAWVAGEVARGEEEEVEEPPAYYGV